MIQHNKLDNLYGKIVLARAPDGSEAWIESWPHRNVVEIHAAEREESLAEEGRIARAEVWCLVLVALFVLVRQLWLV